MSNTNKNLNKAFNDYIGSASLVTNEDRKRFFRRMNKNNKKSHWMPKVITALVAALLITGAYIGYQSSLVDIVEEPEDITIEEKTADYPEKVKAKIADLPEDVQNRLIVPTEFPDEPKSFTFRVDLVDPMQEESRILSTEFAYGGAEVGWGLFVTTWHTEVIRDNVDPTETVTLDNGKEAIIFGNDSSKSIEWKGEEGMYHNIMLMQLESQFTVDDLVKIANSME
ncbi:hypothetical protein GH741_02280 [Aquibacillus halophilus]|uniref:DUF4367 domain-containing protein n=1 Tax=Aquibacillus halophilus TaxID=930132 RepID=A0A6A8DCA1_9BACI|nr:hypothetical protein [Aquibacillus halophilus]MRH41499.1 hypothetical protein [Aquibacillus halophilus]